MKKMEIRYLATAVTAVALSLAGLGNDYLSYNMLTSGDPWKPRNHDDPIGIFYGYSSSSSGPGADAFQKCLDLQERSQVPLVVYWGMDNCSSCSTFAKELNDMPNSASILMGHAGCILAYFRGTGTGPAACADARAFFDTPAMKAAGGAKGSCHILGFYAKYPDGTEFARSAVAPLKMSNYFGKIATWRTEYYNDYSNHLHRLPASDSIFVAGTNALNRLEAMPETENVWVPLARTNNWDGAYNEKVVAKYPDGTSATNVLPWVANATNSGVNVSVSGKWQSGKGIDLVLLSTNSESVVTSKISFVSSRANSMAFPYYAGETNELATGGWSMDPRFIETSAGGIEDLRGVFAEASATNAQRQAELSAASRAYDTATNNLAAAITATNEAYSAWIAAQDEYTGYSTNEYAAATNELAQAIAATNLAYVAWTNAQNACVLATNDLSSASNSWQNAIQQYGQNSTEANNAFEWVLESSVNLRLTEKDCADKQTDYESKVGDITSKEQVVYIAEGELERLEGVCTDKQGDYDTAVSAMPDKEQAVADAQTELERLEGVCTDKQGDYDTAVSAMPAKEQAVADASVAVSGAEGFAEAASAALETACGNLKSAESNIFLVVSGSVVADARMAKLAEFFATGEYKAWALANKVRNIVLDCPEDPEAWSGASLLTYDKASATGASGAYYLSCKGLDPAAAEILSAAAFVGYRLFREESAQDATAPEVLLVRADGTVFAHVPAYSAAGGAFETAENIARLTEALSLAGEETEAGNDEILTTDLELGWNRESAAQTLQLSDAADCFALKGIPAQTALKFTVAAGGKSPALTVVDKSGNTLEPQFEGGIYAFTAAQIDAGLFVRVESGIDAAAKHGGKTAFGYTLTAGNAESDSGTAGFAASSVSIKEGGAAITNGVYKMALVRKGYTGSAKVSVSLNRELTTAESAAYGWEPETQFVEWANLESGAKYLDLSLPDDETWLGDGDIVFDLAVVDGSAQAGIARFTVSYQDNDPAEEGVLLIDSVVHPGKSGDGKYYIKAGDTLKIDVRRRDGSRGVADGILTVKAGGKAFATNCLHWAEKDPVPVKQADIELPGELFAGARTEAVVTLTASNGFKVVSSASTVKIQVLNAKSPAFECESAVFSGTQYTTFSNTVALAEVDGDLTLLRVEKLSGSLPSGLKASLDAEGGKLVISGTPTAATTAKSTYRAVLKCGNSTVYSLPVDVTIDITALAEKISGFDAARSYTGIPAIAFDGVTNRLCGIVDLTVSAKGKTSARYRKAGGKSVSFSAGALGDVEIDGGGNPYIEVEAGRKASGLEYFLSVTFSNDGSITGEIADPELENGPAAFAVPAAFRPWSKDNPAEDYEGNATLALPLADPENMHENTLCTGAAALRLKFDTAAAWRSGKVTFSGTLANGEKVNGTATLSPDPGYRAMQLAVFSSSSSDTLSALLEVDGASAPAASAAAVPFWSHVEKNIPAASYANDLAVDGSLYDKAVCGDPALYSFFCDRGPLDFTLNKTSGIAAGSFKFKEEGKTLKPKWKAVALPGAEDGTPCGAYWYGATFEYDDEATGERRKCTVRKGGPVLSGGLE